MALNPQGEDSANIVVRGLATSLSTKTISRVANLPLGIRWRNEEREASVTTRKKLFIQRENHIEDKNVVRRENLLYPWDEVAYHIIKYISCEGRLRIIYSYHFRLLHELRFKTYLPIPERLSDPHFILQSIIETS